MAVATDPSKRIATQQSVRRPIRHDFVPALLLGGPAFLLLLVFLIGPFFMGILFSFTDQRLVSPKPAEYVGARNYDRLLHVAVLPLDPIADPQTGQPQRDETGQIQYPRSREFTRNTEKYPQYAGLTEWFNIDAASRRYVVLAGDPTFLNSLGHNLFFSLIVIPVQTGLGLLLALLVNQQLRGRNFFRTIYFSPVVTSMVVVSILWTFLYEKNVGLMNHIDGANNWEKFRFVTLPGLRNTTIFIIITITIAAFQLFTQVFVMTNGGPNGATSTITFHMVQKGFREQDIAYASTIAVIFFLIIFGISMIQRFVLRKKEA